MLTVVDPEAEYEPRDQGFIAEIPWSRERIPGRDAMLELQRLLPRPRPRSPFSGNRKRVPRRDAPVRTY
jgi:hypothetical protein